MRAQFFLTQRIVEDMLKHGGGAVCNVTSIHGVSAAPEHRSTPASKGAIIAYTRTLAVELAHKGIRVNAIAPGCVPVENYAKVLGGYDPAATAEWAKNAIPVGHVGTPLDIAKLAVFLCSDDAEFIVGQTIVADGGTTSLMSLISDFRNESAARFGKGYLPGRVIALQRGQSHFRDAKGGQSPSYLSGEISDERSGMTTMLGFLAVAVSGFLVGAGNWPYKVMRTYRFEHWMLLDHVVGAVVVSLGRDPLGMPERLPVPRQRPNLRSC